MARPILMNDNLPRGLLEAIGEVAVAESQLETIMINALKRAFRISVTEALERADTNEWRSFDNQKKALLRKFKSDFPGEASGIHALCALLVEAEEAREQRHAQIHSVAVVDLESGQPLRLHKAKHIGDDESDLKAIRDRLRQVRNSIEVFTRQFYLDRKSA